MRRVSWNRIATMEERHAMTNTTLDETRATPTGRSSSGRRVALALVVLVALGAVLSGLGLARARAGTIGTGVVVIDTTLGYEDGSAAGTGMVLTPNGKVLTNNHVIEGATAIKVVIPGTGRSYTARVLGYSVKNDVAVLKLQNASNLATVSTSSAKLRLGQIVSATGNARGAGTLSTVTGTVTGLSKTITAGDGQGNAEQLTGLIETNANVVSGDSGGPLTNSNGRVVGMVTAASTSGGFNFRGVSASDAFAIPINKALAIVRTVAAGKNTAAVHVGGTAFLGVSVTGAGAAGYESGVAVVGVASGGPAESAGLERGDVIVGLAGKSVDSPSALRARVLALRPGQTVKVVYLDYYGVSNTASVTLTSGPPQ
jgi:S1-C subfamily serine protease